MRQAAACKCGQVLFDVVERKAGDMLICPWCNSEYRYLGDGKVEPKDGKPASGDKMKKPESKEVEKEKEKKEPERKEEKHEKEKKEPAEAKHSPEKYGTRKQDKIEPPSPSPKGSRRLNSRKEDVPGGIPTMIGFIVGFNGLAFVALAFIRTTEWGSFMPKSATWPLIAALIVGHIVGFFAWSAFVYYKTGANKNETAQGSGDRPGSA